MMAILYALQWIERNKQDDILICSDSVLALQILKTFNPSHPDIMFRILDS